MAQDFSIEKPEVANALAENLGNAVVLYFKAHGHHWNVVGNDFSQFHDFFEEIYEDIYSSFDPLAENMRKLNAFAPYKLVEFAQLASVKDANVGTNAMSMCKDLYDSNEIMIRSLDNCFAIANEVNEQGIADFIAGRIDMHKKWRWQLNAFLSSESSGKFEAVQPVEVETEEVFMDEQPIFAAGKIAQTPAPKKDRVKGSKTNAKGSASGTKAARKVKFSQKTENALKAKVTKHNEKASKGRKASLSMLKAVYRRGAGAFSTSHRPGMGRDQWAMGRVNAYLQLLRSGKPSNSNYTTDNDLLPASHPRSTKKKASITASGLIPEEQALAEALLYITNKYGKFDQDGDGVWAGYRPAAENDVASIGVKCSNCVFYQGGEECAIISLPVEPEGKCRFAVIPEGVVDVSQVPVRDKQDLELLLATAYAEGELLIELKNQEEYSSVEEAIFAMAEFSGFGYEIETPLKAAWARGVRDEQNPFDRALDLAEFGYQSIDADLLPIKERVDNA